MSPARSGDRAELREFRRGGEPLQLGLDRDHQGARRRRRGGAGRDAHVEFAVARAQRGRDDVAEAARQAHFDDGLRLQRAGQQHRHRGRRPHDRTSRTPSRIARYDPIWHAAAAYSTVAKPYCPSPGTNCANANTPNCCANARTPISVPNW